MNKTPAGAERETKQIRRPFWGLQACENPPIPPPQLCLPTGPQTATDYHFTPTQGRRGANSAAFVLQPNGAPRRPRTAPRRPKMAQHGPEDGPQIVPRRHQHASILPLRRPNGFKTAHNGSKTSPKVHRGPKTSQRMAQRTPEEAHIIESCMCLAFRQSLKLMFPRRP